ncbi:hypothetical protein HQ403_01265, partial [Candidatus Kaiserbacteria bacterium]|nr:hypothetical protein [Candidatus Kaiserbacteria bacterium]
LSIFYGDGEFTVESNKSPDFFKFLKNAKDDIDGPRGNIETLADIDLSFKELLNTKLGWNL